MNSIIKFIKDIFMINKEDNFHIGLTSFKNLKKETNIEKDEEKKSKEVKLSDLMRRVY